MSDFEPLAPYHRFFLRKHYQCVDIVHAVYRVARPTPAGAWIIEDIPGSFEERWVGRDTYKAYAYQDVGLAWRSFGIRMLKRKIHAQNELDAVVAALTCTMNSMGKHPEDYIRVIGTEPLGLIDTLGG